MEKTQYIDIANLRSITGRRRVTAADAIALAESRLYYVNGDDIVVEDVSCKRLRNSAAWAVTFTIAK